MFSVIIIYHLNITSIHDKQPEAGVLADIDKAEFSRVIENLIVNAVKHNDYGIKILSKLKSTNGKIKIIIADSGTPISKEDIDRVFEPFHSSDDSRITKNGSGLGLAIAKRIVELHHGKIFINDNIVGYTKAFVIEL